MRRYVVSKLARKAPPTLPKEVVETGPRTYRDRWGIEYEVKWNGQPSDFSLIGDYPRAASS